MDDDKEEEAAKEIKKKKKDNQREREREKERQRTEKRARRCRDTAGRTVNYKRSAKPLWSSLSGAGVSRRIDNAGLAG